MKTTTSREGQFPIPINNSSKSRVMFILKTKVKLSLSLSSYFKKHFMLTHQDPLGLLQSITLTQQIFYRLIIPPI